IRTGQVATAARPASSASTSAVVSAYSARIEGSPKFDACEPGKPPTKPLAPTIPTSTSRGRQMAWPGSSTVMRASSRTATSSSRASDCQSWLPSTVKIGVFRSRHASASTCACSGSPCVVRSPASRIRSTVPSISANALAICSRLASEQCMSPAAAIFTRGPSDGGPGRPVASTGIASVRTHVAGIEIGRVGMRRDVPDHPFNDIEATLKRCVAAFREAGIPALLAGSLAVWARGGPETRHDLDFVVKPSDAERALQALTEAGMKAETPPEGWLLKAWDGDVLVDVIYEPRGLVVDDDLIARGEEREVMAIGIRLMALEDVLTSKLMALDEHSADYSQLLLMTRTLREQIDWGALRARTGSSPFAKAFFTLAEELSIAPPAGDAVDAPAARARVRVLDG